MPSGVASTSFSRQSASVKGRFVAPRLVFFLHFRLLIVFSEHTSTPIMDSPAKEKMVIDSPNEKIADSTPKETVMDSPKPKMPRPFRARPPPTPKTERLQSMTRVLRSSQKDADSTPSMNEENSCELFIEPSPKRGRLRGKRASSITSTVTEPEVKDVGVGTATTDDGTCSQIGPHCNIDAGGLANKSVRQKSKQPFSEPSHLYEFDEDKTISTMASKEDWAARRNRKRPSKYTKRVIMGKAIEYGIVAGVAVAIFAFVVKRYQ